MWRSSGPISGSCETRERTRSIGEPDTGETEDLGTVKFGSFRPFSVRFKKEARIRAFWSIPPLALLFLINQYFSLRLEIKPFRVSIHYE